MRKIEAAVCGITLLYVFSTIGTIYCLIMGSYLTLFLISDTVAVLCFMSYIAISLFIYLRTNLSFKDSRTLKICLIIMATGIFLFGWYCFGCFRILSDIKSVSLPGPFCRMRLRRLARWLPIILFVCYAVFNGGWILRWNGHSGCGQWRLLGAR